MCGGASTTLTMTFTGTAPYTFVYTDGTHTSYSPQLASFGLYSISFPGCHNYLFSCFLTDGNSCSGTLSGSAVVTINTVPVLILTGTNLTCNNDNSGAVDLTATGNKPV